MMRKFSFMSLLMLSPHLMASTSDIDARLLDFQRQQQQQATEVHFASTEAARAAAISHHDVLLSGDWKERVLVMQLDEQAKRQLAPYATNLVPVVNWQPPRMLSNELGNQQQTGIGGFACYETVEETYATAAKLAQDYPNYASWQPVGSAWAKSQGKAGFDLYVLKLTKNNGVANKPVLLINSAIHAREYATAPLILAFAKSLLSGIGNNADADWILERHEIHLILHTNPEGRKIAEQGILWRKNINDTSCVTGNYGVDLNRNFGFGWGTVPTGSSGDSCNLTYRGVSPSSEPETKILEQYARSVFKDNRGPLRTDAAPAQTPGIHLDIHSFSELVLWPWGADATPAPNGTALQTLGRKLAWFNDYYPTQSIGLYPTDGTSDGVSYGELGVAAFTFEIGTSFFQPCATYQNRVLPDNLKALWYAARVTAAPYILPAGPEVQALQLNTTEGKIRQDQSLTVQFRLTDRQTNQLNGVEPSQNISKAELFINQFPSDAIAPDVLLNVQDGAFDSPIEMVGATLPNLPIGQHRLYMRGVDASGQIGPVYATYVDVTAASQDPLISLNFSVECQFLRCMFRNTSQVASGSNLQFSWQFGAGQSSQAVAPEFTFSAAGTYPVSLTTNSLGTPRVLTKNLQVYAQPQLNFSSNCNGLSCDFTAQASSANGAVVQYNWQLAGVTATGNPLRFNFTNAGSYPVTLTIKDSAEQQASLSQTVTVSTLTPPPVVTEKASGGTVSSVYSLCFLMLCFGWRRYVSGLNTIRPMR